MLDLITTPSSPASPIFASAVWGIVLWLFEHHPSTLQSSLQSSMKYLYHDSDRWTGSLDDFVMTSHPEVWLIDWFWLIYSRVHGFIQYILMNLPYKSDYKPGCITFGSLLISHRIDNRHSSEAPLGDGKWKRWNLPRGRLHVVDLDNVDERVANVFTAERVDSTGVL